MLTFEARGLHTGAESEMELRGRNFIGNLFYGAKGYMLVEDSGFKTFLGEDRQPGETMRATPQPLGETAPHMTNFLAAIRSRREADLVAPVTEAAISADLVHAANISYRVGRKLTLTPERTSFAGDAEASALLTRHPYRAPYIVA